MKYAPIKVFIKSNNGYEELSYQEFYSLWKTDEKYRDKLFLPLYGMLMEVTRKEYEEFYRNQRRQKYINESAEKKSEISFDALVTDGFNGEELLIDPGEGIADLVERNLMRQALQKALHMLTTDEQHLIQSVFFEGMTEREYASAMGVCRNTIHKRKVRILAKLKKILEKLKI